MDNLRLVLCDIDGTIVNEERILTPLSREVLKKLHKNGILLGIASGRSVYDVIHSTSSWDLGFEWDVVIGLNGIEFWDGLHQKLTRFYDLQPAVIRQALADFGSVFEFNPFIYRNDQLIFGWEDEQMIRSASHAHMSCHKADGYEEFWAEPTGKIMLRIYDPDQMPVMEEYARTHPSPYYKAFKTQPTLLEVCDPRVSKALPYDTLCQAFDLTPTNIAAFGDTSNDNEMLEQAGLGVCLANGTADTKACADLITEYTNEEDGWARFMLSHFPKETR